MNVYVYQADLWCEDCGQKIREELTAKDEAPEDITDENTYDSDDFPKGPYPDGGGEADTPQHCGAGEDCINAEQYAGKDGPKVGMFLENPLTSDGYDYVREAMIQKKVNGRWVGGSSVAHAWASFYEITLEDEE